MIWHCPIPERWGAFAGGFEEVDENVEYHEREDEFDIVSYRRTHLCISTLIYSPSNRKMKRRPLGAK